MIAPLENLGIDKDGHQWHPPFARKAEVEGLSVGPLWRFIDFYVLVGSLSGNQCVGEPLDSSASAREPFPSFGRNYRREALGGYIGCPSTFPANAGAFEGLPVRDWESLAERVVIASGDRWRRRLMAKASRIAPASSGVGSRSR